MNQLEAANLPVRKIELICPNCQSNLMNGKAVNSIRTGIQKNTLIFSYKNNWFDWEEYEFGSDEEEYTCVACGADVSEIIRNYI